MRTLGAAVIGTGFIGPVHAEAIRRLGHRVVGVLGSTPPKGRAAAKALGVPTAYADLAALLADPAVEVVHLATPNRHHFAQARAVLEAGRHVVVEKPLAMTSAETAELVRLAAARPAQVAAVNYNVRFYPLCLDARARVRAGELGDVFHVTGSYLQDWLLFPTDFNWRVSAADGGDLRAVADIGTHGSTSCASSPASKSRRCAPTCGRCTRCGSGRRAGARRSRGRRARAASRSR